MFWIGYRFSISIFHIAAKLKSIWDDKTSKFLKGRRDQLDAVSYWFKANNNPVIQIHAASLGEFELSIPLYLNLKEKYPNHKFLFTFFSPSGYENANIPEGAMKAYLPIDKARLVSDFINVVKPKLVIFIKYEFWFEYLRQLKNHNIAYGFVNINQQKITLNLKFAEAKKLVNQASFICASNEITSSLLSDNGLKCDGVFTDLRYSQSFNILHEKYNLSKDHERFLTDKKIVICGSVWKEDLAVIENSITKHNDLSWVIAPHELSKQMLSYLEQRFINVSLFSTGKMKPDSRILVIDTIGDLKYLYKYGQVNYVGGAFKTGLHNVIEPLYAESPIVFGPNHENFPEAKFLLNNDLAYSINKNEDFDSLIQKMKSGSILLNATNKLKNINEDLERLTTVVTNDYEYRF